jgi:hypothetical protein
MEIAHIEIPISNYLLCTTTSVTTSVTCGSWNGPHIEGWPWLGPYPLVANANVTAFHRGFLSAHVRHGERCRQESILAVQTNFKVFSKPGQKGAV